MYIICAQDRTTIILISPLPIKTSKTTFRGNHSSRLLYLPPIRPPPFIMSFFCHIQSHLPLTQTDHEPSPLIEAFEEARKAAHSARDMAVQAQNATEEAKKNYDKSEENFHEAYRRYTEARERLDDALERSTESAKRFTEALERYEAVFEGVRR